MSRAVRMLARGVLTLTLAVPTMLAAQGTSSTPPRSSRSVLTQDDMKAVHAESVFEAIEALRSLWLRDRGPTSFGGKDSLSGIVPIVYLDNVKLGVAETLKRVRVGDVVSVQHLSGPEANARYGVGHGAGAIVVSTMPVRQPDDDASTLVLCVDRTR